MTHEEYQRLKLRLGMSPVDWCRATGMSRDTDKSYSCGRLPIPDQVAETISALTTERDKKVAELQAVLAQLLPECVVVLEEEKQNLLVQAPDGTLIQKFVNEGKDITLSDIYTFGSHRRPNVLRYCKVQTENGKAAKPGWALWRATLTLGTLGRLDSSANPLTSDLLRNVLGMK